jgi:hypothetical protein
VSPGTDPTTAILVTLAILAVIVIGVLLSAAFSGWWQSRQDHIVLSEKEWARPTERTPQHRVEPSTDGGE